MEFGFQYQQIFRQSNHMPTKNFKPKCIAMLIFVVFNNTSNNLPKSEVSYSKPGGGRILFGVSKLILGLNFPRYFSLLPSFHNYVLLILKPNDSYQFPATLSLSPPSPPPRPQTFGQINIAELRSANDLGSSWPQFFEKIESNFVF